MSSPTQDQRLIRVIAGLPRTSNTGKQELQLIARLEDAVAITDHFVWNDGRDLFTTSTKHLRYIMQDRRPVEHVAIKTWETVSNQMIVVNQRCKAI